MVCMMMSLMALSCIKRESDVTAGTVSVNLDSALPLKEAALSVDILMLNDSLSSHFPGSITKVEWMGDSILILDSWKDPGLYLYDSCKYVSPLDLFVVRNHYSCSGLYFVYEKILSLA